MRSILILGMIIISFAISAQNIKCCQMDTTAVSVDEPNQNFILTSLSINSKNFWRGNVYGNNTPSISGTLGLKFKNKFELGAIATSPINGHREGYGTWMELYVAQTIKKFTFTVDDYYFFNPEDSLNDYGNWDYNETQHLIEGRVKYDAGKFNFTASYVLYSAKGLDNSLYVEAEYYLLPELLSMSIGGIFGASALNFYNAAGVTHFGFTGYRNIPITKEFSVPLRMSLMTSPNYKNASDYPKFTQNPINFVIGISL